MSDPRHKTYTQKDCRSKPASSLKRDARGVRLPKKVSDEAGIDFSEFHRSLSRDCYFTDIDGLEYRFERGELRLKVLLEIKAWHVIQQRYVLSANTRALYELSRRANLPCWFIWWHKNIFALWRISETGITSQYLAAREYYPRSFYQKILEQV